MNFPRTSGLLPPAASRRGGFLATSPHPSQDQPDYEMVDFFPPWTRKRPVGWRPTDSLAWASEEACVLSRQLGPGEWIAWPVDPASNELILSGERRGRSSFDATLEVFIDLGLAEREPPMPPFSGLHEQLPDGRWRAIPFDDETGELMPKYAGEGTTRDEAERASWAAITSWRATSPPSAGRSDSGS